MKDEVFSKTKKKKKKRVQWSTLRDGPNNCFFREELCLGIVTGKPIGWLINLTFHLANSPGMLCKRLGSHIGIRWQLGHAATETRRRTASGFVAVPFCHNATAVGGSCGMALGCACADGLANALAREGSL